MFVSNARARARGHTHTHTRVLESHQIMESHLEAEVAHKQMTLLRLERADFDRLQGLLSPRDDME